MFDLCPLHAPLFKKFFKRLKTSIKFTNHDFQGRLPKMLNKSLCDFDDFYCSVNLFEPRCEKTNVLHTAKLISAFVFST